jgi:hypothetical protein
VERSDYRLQFYNARWNKNHERRNRRRNKEFTVVQKLTHFFTQVSKNESFRKGIAAAGAGAVIAVISTLVWGES